jgi:hypothetical protein
MENQKPKTSVEFLVDKFEEKLGKGIRTLMEQEIKDAKTMNRGEFLHFWVGGIKCTEENGLAFDQYHAETFKTDTNGL